MAFSKGQRINIQHTHTHTHTGLHTHACMRTPTHTHTHTYIICILHHFDVYTHPGTRCVSPPLILNMHVLYGCECASTQDSLRRADWLLNEGKVEDSRVLVYILSSSFLLTFVFYEIYLEEMNPPLFSVIQPSPPHN